MTEHLDTIALLGLLSAAVWTDQRTHRIPNALVIAMLCCGLVVQTYLHGLAGLSQAGLGVLAGFVVFFVPYLKGGMAAGDVKLLSATGAFLGPVWVLLAGGIAMLAGASIAGSLLAYQHYRGARRSVEQALTMKFPFAAAIALGTACLLVARETFTL
jgi:prepilin peptidase CpaA